MMMCCPKFLGACAIAPTAVLLTISFFVLIVVRKVNEQGLKIFGYVAVSLLWIAAAIIFSAGIYIMTNDNSYMMKMMKCKMHMMDKMKKHIHQDMKCYKDLETQDSSKSADK